MRRLWALVSELPLESATKMGVRMWAEQEKAATPSLPQSKVEGAKVVSIEQFAARHGR